MKFLQKTLRLVPLSAALVLAWGGAYAGSNSTTMDVTATVQPSCNISANPLAFGQYLGVSTHSASGTDLLQDSSVTVTCVQGANASIGINEGNFASTPGDITTRRLKHTIQNSYLSYQLYQPTSNTPGAGCSYSNNLWGNTPGNSSSVLGLATAPSIDPRTYTVCGSVPKGQDPLNGNFNDTVQVNVYFNDSFCFGSGC